MDEVAVKFKECYQIFKKELYKSGDSIACNIHEAFHEFSSGNHHNCLGCNFAEITDMILAYLKKYRSLDDIQKDFTIYILLLYLLSERVETILEIVQIPDKYKDKHFKVFQQVRKWANFIKHPKAFVLTHHPDYDFEGSNIPFFKKGNYTIEINEQFVQEYYTGRTDLESQKKINKELYTILRNKKDILVLFPDIAQLTKKMCYSFNKFIELITQNQVYTEILNDEATLNNYFENAE